MSALSVRGVVVAAAFGVDAKEQERLNVRNAMGMVVKRCLLPLGVSKDD
jgi:hypothetical protein